jgi:hypothetical protein
MSMQDKHRNEIVVNAESLAIMQPYFFPYIGYFQLVKAVEKFIFYDDVNFIKQGWINRNRILINGIEKYITLSLCKASPNKLIHEIEIQPGNEKLLKTIEQAYSKAPYFNDVMPLIQDVFCMMPEIKKISEIAAQSVKKISEYLGLKTVFETSSQTYCNTRSVGRADRLIAICKENGYSTYINPAGGQDLYKKDYFSERGVTLYFINSRISTYKQFKHDFIPGLSIIDVLMFNSIETVHSMLNDYTLIQRL